MIAFLKMGPYVEVIEHDKIPNSKTAKAMQEAEKGEL